MKKIVYSLLLVGALMSCNKQDQMLNDYEKLIDKYEKVSKKIVDGDNSAMLELEEIVEEGKIITDKIEEAKKNSKLTPEQEKRYEKLELRLMNVASSAMKKTSDENNYDTSFED